MFRPPSASSATLLAITGLLALPGGALSAVDPASAAVLPRLSPAGAPRPAQPPDSLTRFEFIRPVMGTEFRIVLHAADSTVAADAADAAFGRAEELESTLSDWDPASELSRLSGTAGTGEWVEVGADLWRVVSLAQEWAAITGGAFDVTAGPLTRLWRWADRRGIAMPEARRAEALGSVGWENLELDAERRAVRLIEPGMRLDPGGIAKGYTVDEMSVALLAAGQPYHLVDAGGDMRINESPPGASQWRVGLPVVVSDARIDESDAGSGFSRMILATSGDTYRHTETDGERLSHILDPRTGRSVPSRRIVTAVIPMDPGAEPLSGAIGDLLATAASVMSREELEKMEVPPTVRGTLRVLEFDEARRRWTTWFVHFNERDR